MKKLILSCCLIMLPLLAEAEENSVSIEDFAFLQGYWKGEGFGGTSEEMWMPPADGSMFGIFKQSSDGELQFTEFMEIGEVDGAFVLRLKHFNPDFSGWEDKESYVTFAFESAAENRATFNGLSYELVAADQLQVKLLLRQSDGKLSTEVFNLYRN